MIHKSCVQLLMVRHGGQLYGARNYVYPTDFGRYARFCCGYWNIAGQTARNRLTCSITADKSPVEEVSQPVPHERSTQYGTRSKCRELLRSTCLYDWSFAVTQSIATPFLLRSYAAWLFAFER